jgi:hypothetical protein
MEYSPQQHPALLELSSNNATNSQIKIWVLLFFTYQTFSYFCRNIY